ncbi:MAG: winged helix-turn-helix domain-containing protein, partial [Acidobacteriota bacterium]
MSEFQDDNYEFGEFRVDASKRLLIKGDDEVMPLTPKVFDLLLYLVRHNGKLIEKDELMSAIWTDTIVEENNLSQNISILRRVLGEKRGEHQYIATIPGHGYKFVAPVKVQGSKFKSQGSIESEILNLESESQSKNKLETHQDQGPKTKNQNQNFLIVGAFISVLAVISAVYFWRQNPAKMPIKTVAVLPFKPLSAENRDEILEIGMADTLIARLGANREIVVRPLSSVRRFGNLEQDPLAAGRELDVETVLDGSIQRVEDKIRVNVRLLKTADGASLWSATFDEKFTDIFVVQDAISKKVAEALKLQLVGNTQTEKSSTQNVEAYRFYLQGRYHALKSTPPEIRQGITFYQQAIDSDPTYALAYA